MERKKREACEIVLPLFLGHGTGLVKPDLAALLPASSYLELDLSHTLIPHGDDVHEEP